MPDIALRISFPGHADFLFEPDETLLSSEIPDWAQFSRVPCPGNHLHGPDIDYCRLACQLQNIVNYFKNIKSIDRGSLSVVSGQEKEIHIRADAQSIFFHVVQLLLSNTSCSVFARDQHLRPYYQLSDNPQELFYKYFSIFLVESYCKDPTQPVNLQQLKDEIELKIHVLDSLVVRLNLAAEETDADASRNGLVIFESLLQLMDFNLEKYLATIQQQLAS